jgi:cytochrome c
MKKNHLMMIVTFFVTIIALNFSAQAADPAKGKKVFKQHQCWICHSLKTGEKKMGPRLLGVIGRKAGTVPGFNYSSAMKKAGKNGLVWTEETLNKYIKAPRKFVPGNRMPFAGLGSKTKREDLIAYLKSVAP